MLIPAVYNTFRIYFISSIPNEWGFNIASQIAWLNIIYEILQEGITLPLFFILGTVHNNRSHFRYRLFSGLKVIVPIYILVALLVWIFSSQLVSFLNQSPNLIQDTIDYIKLEAIAIPLRVILDICFIVLILLSERKSLYILLIFQLFFRVVADYLLIGSHFFNFGVNGVAYSSITIYLTSSLAGLFLISRKLPLSGYSSSKIQFDWASQWIKISLLSGLESGIRNTAFIVMILKLVNEIEKSGVLWVANSFIWNWLLLPILALGSLIKKDTGTSKGLLRDRFFGYFILTGFITLIWLFSIPLWDDFIRLFMGVTDYDEIKQLVLVFLIFYVVFSFNNILDSYFYGMGRTDLMLYQSLIVNTVYYAIFYLLYLKGIFILTLFSVALLFGFGIVVDFFATVFIFRLVGYPKK